MMTSRATQELEMLKKNKQKTRNAKKIKMVGSPSGLRTIMKYAVFLKCFGCKARKLIYN